jgi:hypothetical protein
MMFLKSRLATLSAVIAALAVGAAVPSASAATTPGQWIVPSSCAQTNPATGCAPYWSFISAGTLRFSVFSTGQ